MRLRTVYAKSFKRFTDLKVTGLNDTTKLIILAGPNGSGKSSFFDALKTWHWYNGAPATMYDPTYHDKFGTEDLDGNWTSRAQVTTNVDVGAISPEARKKLVYVRSAHRNEAEFAINGLSQLNSPLDSSRVNRTIDNDMSVSQNYQRLLMDTFTAVFDETADDATTRKELRDHFIAKVRDALQSVFPDLRLTGISNNPLAGGTFTFSKGSASNFPYKNLSAGEKAAFDLLLDMVMAGRFYDDTLWCMDEPETHLNTRVQAKLLDQLVKLLPSNCQLILASHSLGFMRRAWEIAQTDPSAVQFLDFNGLDFDIPVEMTPTEPSRQFWEDTLEVALGDLAALMAPEKVVLCEGRPASASRRASNSEFDARCYRKIFASEFPTTDFVSIGNSSDVANDKIELGRSIQTINSGTSVTRVVDRDLLNETEVAEHQAAGVKVLSRRNIEAYLLDDDVLRNFAQANLDANVEEVMAEKLRLVSESVGRGNDADDLKSIAGEIYTYLRRRYSLSGSGSSWNAFAADTLSMYVTRETVAYQELKQSLFS